MFPYCEDDGLLSNENLTGFEIDDYLSGMNDRSQVIGLPELPSFEQQNPLLLPPQLPAVSNSNLEESQEPVMEVLPPPQFLSDNIIHHEILTETTPKKKKKKSPGKADKGHKVLDEDEMDDEEFEYGSCDSYLHQVRAEAKERVSEWGEDSVRRSVRLVAKDAYYGKRIRYLKVTKETAGDKQWKIAVRDIALEILSKPEFLTQKKRLDRWLGKKDAPPPPKSFFGFLQQVRAEARERISGYNREKGEKGVVGLAITNTARLIFKKHCMPYHRLTKKTAGSKQWKIILRQILLEVIKRQEFSAEKEKLDKWLKDNSIQEGDRKSFLKNVQEEAGTSVDGYNENANLRYAIARQAKYAYTRNYLPFYFLTENDKDYKKWKIEVREIIRDVLQRPQYLDVKTKVDIWIATQEEVPAENSFENYLQKVRDVFQQKIKSYKEKPRKILVYNAAKAVFVFSRVPYHGLSKGDRDYNEWKIILREVVQTVIKRPEFKQQKLKLDKWITKNTKIVKQGSIESFMQQATDLAKRKISQYHKNRNCRESIKEAARRAYNKGTLRFFGLKADKVSADNKWKIVVREIILTVLDKKEFANKKTKVYDWLDERRSKLSEEVVSVLGKRKREPEKKKVYPKKIKRRKIDKGKSLPSDKPVATTTRYLNNHSSFFTPRRITRSRRKHIEEVFGDKTSSLLLKPDID